MTDQEWHERRKAKKPDLGFDPHTHRERRKRQTSVCFDQRRRYRVQLSMANHGGNPAEITWALSVAQTTQKQLAQRLQVSPPAVNAVIKGNSRSQRIENAIGEAISTPLHVIFPFWYEKHENLEGWNQVIGKEQNNF